MSLPPSDPEEDAVLIPGKPHPLGLGEHPEATARLRASCPLQYEAVMDRVQKSKLSLYKKAMEVGARLLDILGWQGPGCVPQETWGGHRAQGLPQTLTQGHVQ